MWKKVYEIAKRLFLLTQEVEKQKKEISELRQELKELTALVHRIAFEVQRISEREMHEREKIELRLENQLLKFERRLPAGRQGENDKEMD